MPEKYDVTIDPEEVSQIYTTTIQEVGGGPRVIINYFHITVRGTARSWLKNLLSGSVRSWRELCEQFVTNFSWSFTRPGMRCDLLAVQQSKGETL